MSDYSYPYKDADFIINELIDFIVRRGRSG